MPPYSAEVFTGFSEIRPSSLPPVEELRAVDFEPYYQLYSQMQHENTFKDNDEPPLIASGGVIPVTHEYVFVMDATGSMGRYIDSTRDHIVSLINDCRGSATRAVEEYGRTHSIQQKLFFQVGGICYRDLDDETEFPAFDLSSKVKEYKTWLDGIKAPNIGLRVIVWLADPPPHGRRMMNDGDDDDNHSADMKDAWEIVFKKMNKLGIVHVLFKLKPFTDKANKAFEDLVKEHGATVKVVDTPSTAAASLASGADGSSFVPNPGSNDPLVSAMGLTLPELAYEGQAGYQRSHLS